MDDQKHKLVLDAIIKLQAIHITHKPTPVVHKHIETVPGSFEIRIFETSSSDGATLNSLFWTEEYLTIANKYSAITMVGVEWDDKKDRKNKPYFVIF